MNKETKINLFIYLLSGRAKAGDLEKFYYYADLKPEREKILVDLIIYGRIEKVINFMEIDQELIVSQEDFHAMVNTNCQDLDFLAAFKAADYLDEPEKSEVIEYIFNEALEYYKNNQDDDEILKSTDYVIREYRKRIDIIGLEQRPKMENPQKTGRK